MFHVSTSFSGWKECGMIVGGMLKNSFMSFRLETMTHSGGNTHMTEQSTIIMMISA